MRSYPPLPGSTSSATLESGCRVQGDLLIHFDDLVAARILNRQLPQHRDLLMSALDTLSEGNTQASLLATLVSASVLTRDQAQYVHTAIQNDKRSRVVQLYAHMLVSHGLPGPSIRQCMDRIGADADVTLFGQVAIAMGLITSQQDHQLSYQVRVVADRDRAQEVRVFLDSRRAAQDYDQTLPPDSSISGVIKLPAAPSDRPAAPPHVSRHSEIQIVAVREADLQPPQFEVPDIVDTSDPLANTCIASYRIIGRVGAGAMGTVYLADSPDEPTRPVALKVSMGETEEAHGRFKREVLANSFFSHHGVIDIYDVGQTAEGKDFLAMEFFDGEDLEQILENEKRLEPKRALNLCKQVYDTLAAAHESGIIHRDLKPANILISRDGERTKLMDFGIAIIRDLGEFEHMVFKTVEGGTTGTPQYMSPEQAACDKLTHSSDLYSAALVLYECLSGKFPFESETSNGFMACHMLEEPIPLEKVDSGCKGLPKALHKLLGQLLDKNPANRPSDAAAVSAELEAILPTIQERKSGRLFGFLWRGRGS